MISKFLQQIQKKTYPTLDSYDACNKKKGVLIIFDVVIVVIVVVDFLSKKIMHFHCPREISNKDDASTIYIYI